MVECKVIRYTPEYRKEFIDYLRKTFPAYSTKYIEYTVDNSIKSNPNGQASVLVLNKNNEIVGCHQFFNTKAYIKGEEKDVCWGYNTYVDQDYRKKVGLDFIVTFTTKDFGIGLSEINRKIHKEMKTTFFDGLYNYCKISPNIILEPVNKLFNNSEAKVLDSLNCISTKYYSFRRVKIADQMRISDGGYWYKDKIDIDYIRDKEFLSHRFFSNKVFTYYVYQIDDKKEYPCYFVVREFTFKGFKALYLVDFRYEYSNVKQLNAIFKAADKIRKKLNCGILFWTSNDPLVEKEFSGKINVFKRYDDLVATRTYRLNKDNTIQVTAADADVDFLRG